jgi:hypothetical protein
MFLLGSLNSPVYLSVPVRDAVATDDFLTLLEERLGLYSRRTRPAGWFSFEPDFYRIEEPGKPVVRCQSIRLGPVKWRMFWARIDNAVYIASKPFILDDLMAAHTAAQKAAPPSDPGPAAHAMVRMRAENWNRVLPEFNLGWAENNRRASLNNLSPIYGVARALLSEATIDGTKVEQLDLGEVARLSQAEAGRNYGVTFFCPDGGEYRLTSDAGALENTLHGSLLSATQRAAPAENVGTTRLLSEVRQVTAALTFETEGLRAVLTIDRKGK